VRNAVISSRPDAPDRRKRYDADGNEDFAIRLTELAPGIVTGVNFVTIAPIPGTLVNKGYA
jgi:hypothetical protein